MFACLYCPQEFFTEKQLKDHAQLCCDPLLRPFSSKSHTCGYCKAIFTTAKKLVAHDDICEVKFRSIVKSQLESITNSLNELKQVKTEQRLNPVECRFCLSTFGTVEEVTAHRKSCEVLRTISIVGKLCTNLSATWGYELPSMISSSPILSAMSNNVIKNSIDSVRPQDDARASSPFPPTPSTSEHKAPKPQVLETVIEEDSITNGESSPIPSSPASKTYSTGNEDIIDIEKRKFQSRGSLKKSTIPQYRKRSKPSNQCKTSEKVKKSRKKQKKIKRSICSRMCQFNLKSSTKNHERISNP